MLLSMRYCSNAVERARKSDCVAATFARICAFKKFGTAIAAKIPIMATTINNSINVNALTGLIFNRSLFYNLTGHYK